MNESVSAGESASKSKSLTVDTLQAMLDCLPKQEPEVLLGYKMNSRTQARLLQLLNVQVRPADPLLQHPLGSLVIEIDETQPDGEALPMIDWKVAALHPHLVKPYLNFVKPCLKAWEPLFLAMITCYRIRDFLTSDNPEIELPRIQAAISEMERRGLGDRAHLARFA